MRLTVVIPTCDRARTLVSTLRTCVRQEDDGLEILVSDNDSTDDTRAVVSSFQDRRLRYVHTGRRLSQSLSWEFALSQVQEGFLFFLGDDDGLLPGAVARARRLLQDSGLEALAWLKARYDWPDSRLAKQRGELRWPLARGLEVRRTRPYLGRLLSLDPRLGIRPHLHLPGLYNGFVALSAVQRARSPGAGFFQSRIPDLYATLALAAQVESYLFSCQPLSLGGSSGPSLGAALMTGSSEAARHFGEGSLPFHPRAEFCPSYPVMLAECLWQVRDHVPGGQDLELDLRLVLQQALWQARRDGGPVRPLVEQAVASMARRNGLPVPQPGMPWRMLLALAVNLLGTGRVNLTRMGVEDIEGAARLAPELVRQGRLKLALETVRTFLSRWG